MNIIKTAIEGVVVLEPKVIGDGRGWFAETFVEGWFGEVVCDTRFVQDNEAFSRYGVLRGLHYQLAPMAQSKLVRAVSGHILDVAVDLREGSPAFGRHVAVELSEINHKQMFVPRGFAHGYVVLSPTALVAYKCDNYYSPELEESLAHDDPALGIDWKIPAQSIILSDKDRDNPRLECAKLFGSDEKLY